MINKIENIKVFETTFNEDINPLLQKIRKGIWETGTVYWCGDYIPVFWYRYPGIRIRAEISEKRYKPPKGCKVISYSDCNWYIFYEIDTKAENKVMDLRYENETLRYENLKLKDKIKSRNKLIKNLRNNLKSLNNF